MRSKDSFGSLGVGSTTAGSDKGIHRSWNEAASDTKTRDVWCADGLAGLIALAHIFNFTEYSTTPPRSMLHAARVSTQRSTMLYSAGATSDRHNECMNCLDKLELLRRSRESLFNLGVEF
eukprot:COSAG05_NODE_4450_length_1510_cov_1.170092_2_plen_120_part_00